MENSLDRFGVRQRLLEGNKSLMDLMIIALCYEKEVNWYIFEGEHRFLGIVNREILLRRNLSNEDCCNIKIRDICSNDEPGIIYWEEDELLINKVNNSFMDHFIEEVAVVDKNTLRLMNIISRREFFNDAITFSAENDEETILYRDLAHYYKPYTKNLNKYVHNVNSQHGEDGILKRLFELVGTTSKYAVEFGGWDGIYLSNIRNLITEAGFRGLFIEGDKEKAAELVNNYRDYPGVSCVEAYVGFKENKKLDDILRENSAPESIDLISIDIDGYDYHVWDSLQNYRSRIIVIEYNPTISNDIIFIPPRSEKVFKGASAAALVELGRKKGYSLAAVTQTNLIFIVEEEFDKLEIYENDLSVLRPVDRLGDGQFFQTYDKEIVLTGVNSYIWAKEMFDTKNPIKFSNI